MSERTPVLPTAAGPPRVIRLRIRNFRSLRDVEFRDLTPMTALLGPNGSGKSTVFDVFAFLSECLSDGLRRAWDRRGRFKELRSRASSGPIAFEIKYRETPRSPLITYHLEIAEQTRGPVVAREWLHWTRGQRGKPFRFLDFHSGEGVAQPEPDDERVPSKLASPDLLAVSTLGQFAANPRVVALRHFIEGWFLCYLSVADARGIPEAGPQEQLTRTGDNLPNVIQYLREQHADRLELIVERLSERVPGVEGVLAEPLADGRLLLRIKDAPFDEPFLSRYASDGTLKMLAYLAVLHAPDPVPLLGIEEPENYLHPRLLPTLAEECRSAAERSQVFVATHSPFFVNGLTPKEVWVLERAADGYTCVQRVSGITGVREFVDAGAQLGALWMEGHFRTGDPLNRAAASTCGRPGER